MSADLGTKKFLGALGMLFVGLVSPALLWLGTEAAVELTIGRGWHRPYPASTEYIFVGVVAAVEGLLFGWLRHRSRLNAGMLLMGALPTWLLLLAFTWASIDMDTSAHCPPGATCTAGFD